MASASRGKRSAGYTVHKRDWPEVWSPEGATEEPSFGTIDYALIVAKRLRASMAKSMDTNYTTSVRLDGRIVAKVRFDGTVDMIQPPKPSDVLP